MGSHNFNPSTREVETRVELPGWREEYKGGEDRNSLFDSLPLHISLKLVFVLNFKKKTVSIDTVFCQMNTLRRYSSQQSQAYVRSKQTKVNTGSEVILVL